MNLSGIKIFSQIEPNPIVYRLARGTIWSLIGTVTARVFSLIATIIIARLLGVADFGAYGMIQSTLEMFGLLAGLSLGVTSSKYVAEFRTKDKEKAGRVLSLTNTFSMFSSGIIGLFIFFLSSWIASGTLKRSDLAPLLSLGAIYLFVTTQNNVQIGALGGFEAFKETAKINSIQGILTPIFAIPLVYLFRLKGALFSMIFLSLLGYVLSRNELNKKCKDYSIDLERFNRSAFREWPIICHFSIPSFMSGLLVMLMIWLTNALLVNEPNGYLELGLFNAANQWRQFIILIPNILTVVMLPILSEAYSEDRKENFGYALRINMKVTWVITLPITIFIIGVREPVAQLFGKTYAGIELLIIVLMITSFLNIINAVIGTALMGSGRMWLGAAMNLGWAVAMIAATLLLVPLYGSLGLALAYLVAYTIHTCWVMIYTDRCLAPRLISDQKQLILVTGMTIIPIIVLAYFNELGILYTFIIFVVSIIPCIRLVKKEFVKLAAQHVRR